MGQARQRSGIDCADQGGAAAKRSVCKLDIRIILNGKDTGKKTPAVLSEVPVGAELKVELLRKGYEPWSGRVLLESQEPRRINAVLTRKRRK